MFEAHKEPAPGQDREYCYEIMVLAQGRWSVDCVMESAAEARGRAQALLARGAGDEIRVLRHRMRRGGQSVTSTIFHEKRPASQAKPGRRISGDAAQALGCQSLAEFSGWQNRRFLATLLRDYLTHHGLLSSELLFDWRRAKRLLNDGSLVNDAVQRVARSQAQRLNEAPKDRAKALEALIAKAAHRARALQPVLQDLTGGRALEAGALPSLDRIGSGLDVGESDLATACLAFQQGDLSHQEQKLDRLIALLPSAPPVWQHSIEIMMAECLLFPDAMKSLFRDKPGAPPLIRRLIDLAEGRGVSGPGDPIDEETPSYAAIAYLIGQGAAPHCAAALQGWIVPILSAKEPLDPSDPAGESRLLELIGRRLRRPDGQWIGGEAARRALENRRRRSRESALRDLGMVSAADSLNRRRR